MIRPFLMAVILLTSCSSAESRDGARGASVDGSGSRSTSAEYYVGKPFSALVADRQEFLPRKRAINRAALGVFSEADGMEIPGQIRKISGKDILVFFTCRRDKCSEASNIILVDIENSGMEVVGVVGDDFIDIVDGPPELAKFARRHCTATSCDVGPVS